MASLRKLKGNYYARIRFSKDGKRKEKLFSLGTSYLREAEKRRLEVNQNLSLVMAGSFIPSWKSKNGLPFEKEYRISNAKEDFIKSRDANGIRESTIKVNKLSLNRFIKAVTDKPVKDITIDDIDLFKGYYKGTLQPASINIDVRTVKTLFNWLKDRNRIESIPKIKQIPVGQSKPIYVTNPEFKEICKRVDPHYRRAFWFYRETGMRLAEPFDGEINGNFLTITADTAKSKREHDIYLTDELKSILLEMRSMVDEKTNRKLSTRENAIKYYSRVFRKACKGDMKKEIEPINDRKFHSLRHSCGARLYLKTRDIYAVSKQLGHSAVKTTEIYTKYDIKRLAQDFPDLIQSNPKQAKKQNGDTQVGVPVQPIFA